MSKIQYRHQTIESFLTSEPLTVDVSIDDGWGASFPVKGIELDATILFADIAGFSRRTLNLSPIETLIFVNHFFAWITAEALRDKNCIVDKYIGDEVMLIFSKGFGSKDPFVEALTAARWMSEKDAFAFCPHIGIASGKVVVGYVGSPLKYEASVFGAPVAMAARCASVKPTEHASTYITFPATEWDERSLDEIYPSEKYKGPDGGIIERPHAWSLTESRDVEMKGLGLTTIRQVINSGHWFPQLTPEERARMCMKQIQQGGGLRA